MTRHILTLSEEVARSVDGYDEVFLWDKGKSSAFTGSLGPYLEKLGPIGLLNLDFVRIALGVFASDRSTSRQRGGSDWNRRQFELTVSVSEPDLWQRHANRLSEIVNFLTGDQWAFVFREAEVGPENVLTLDDASYERTVLLSGGADSATGALLSRHELKVGEGQALVSHFSSTTISPLQKQAATTIRDLVPGRKQIHHQLYLNRGARRLDGSSFQSEPSNRSRSLLFLAVGLAVAEQGQTPLWIPENGFASLNPPLGPDRRGSLSTHTTHPKFLHDLGRLLTDIGAHGAITNPFERMTKGEMFGRLAKTVGTDAASHLLSATNSCAHTDGRYSGASPARSCGVCFGCIVRRASFAAAKLPDSTVYLSDDTSGKYTEFVDQKSILTSMRDFATDGVSRRTIMAMSLPPDYPAREALDLCNRGIEELRAYLG
ncbi:hypothetical protein ACSMXN_21775 [Jatrophihabitans sp. DSM 45814]